MMRIKEQHLIRKSLKVCFGIFTLLLLILFVAAGIKNYIDHKKLVTTVVENNSIINKIEGKTGSEAVEKQITIPNEILSSSGMTEMEVRELVNHMFDENGNITEEGEKLQDIIEQTIVENNEYITYETVEDYSDDIQSMMKELAGLQRDGNNLNGKIDETEDTFSDIVDEMKKSITDSMDEKDKQNNQRMDYIETDINTKFEENNTLLDNRLTSIENDIFIANENFQEYKTFLNEKTDNIYEMFSKLSADDVAYDKDKCDDSVNASTVQEAIDKLGKSVGDGKNLLAAAITAKGGNVAENPTFEQLKQAIMDIPNEITIEQAIQDTSATISYYYHYHDGNDRDGGGCYEWQVVRTYQQPHSEGHSIKTEKTHDGDRWTVYCTVCGVSKTTGRISEHDYSSGDARDEFYDRYGYSHTYYTTENEYGYVLTCGKLDGQIIGAEIKYE